MVLPKVIQSNTCKPLPCKEKTRLDTPTTPLLKGNTVALGVIVNRETVRFQTTDLEKGKNHDL